jgi:hypothetical protein
LWVVNVASGTETAVADVAARVCALAGCRKPLRCLGKERPGDPPHWRADTARLRALVPGWRPLGLDAALARCVGAWMEGRDA